MRGVPSAARGVPSASTGFPDYLKTVYNFDDMTLEPRVLFDKRFKE